jgi:hypothetical protein
MKKYIFLLIIVTFTLQVKAQNYNLPPNPKPGKCYVKCFSYDKKFEWKTIECSKLKAPQKEKTKKELIEAEHSKIKLKKYQEKLLALGYTVNLTGTVDNETIIAHHKYLKKKKKAERKKRKEEKRSKK